MSPREGRLGRWRTSTILARERGLAHVHWPQVSLLRGGVPALGGQRNGVPQASVMRKNFASSLLSRLRLGG